MKKSKIGYKYLYKNNLYKVGNYFQINWFNPLYLDRTGKAMSVMNENTKNWQGGANGYVFNGIKEGYKGEVDINKLWLTDKNPNYIKEKDHLMESFLYFKKDLKKLTKVYEPETFKRIGFRSQFIYTKTNKTKVNYFNNLNSNKLNKLSTEYNLKTRKLHFNLEKEDFSINVIIDYVKKNPQSGSSTDPDRGFLFDIDFFKKYKNYDIKNLDKEIEGLENFIKKNFENILRKSLEGFGMNVKS